MKKDSYVIPCDILEDVIPKAREYGMLYIYYYVGLDPKEFGMSELYISQGTEFLRSIGLLDNMRLKSFIMPVTGTVKIVDFVEEAKKKAEIKLQKDLHKDVITADTLMALFEHNYVILMGYPYKNAPAKEKGMLKLMINEFGAEKSKIIVDKGTKDWVYYSKKPLTIQNLFAIRDEIPVEAPKQESVIEFL